LLAFDEAKVFRYVCAFSVYERGARHHAPKTRDAVGIKEQVEREGN